MIDLDLSGKRAVLTGASLGIGAATVRALADQGARVCFCSRGADNVAALSDSRPPGGEGSVRGFSADMADRGSVEAFQNSTTLETASATPRWSSRPRRGWPHCGPARPTGR